MTEPITPERAKKEKGDGLPTEVIEAFNELLKEKYSNSITIMQNTAIDRILENFRKAGKEVTRNQLFENEWLDVEPYFRKSGWRVEYDKPAYCETYEAYWVFRPKKKKKP